MMKKREQIIFEYTEEGKKGYSISPLDVEEKDYIPENLLKDDNKGMPEISEVEVVRHFTALSHMNYSVDEGFYPLGSCTMKYNPKINEKISSLENFLMAHPYLPYSLAQGNLKLMKTLEDRLKDLTGFDYFTLFPSAGAHGELTGMMMIRKRLELDGNPRKIVLIPDSAHGTNPASSHFAGYDVKEIPSGEKGYLEVETVKEYLNEDVAALMMTNPNTLGVYEQDIKEIAELLHKNGSYLYMDGANFNALMGYVKPAEIGVDVLHLNLHKTFSTPHGGGGPGAGPVGVVKKFEEVLPIPVIGEKNGEYYTDFNIPHTIGKIRSFYGNFGVLIKALIYIMELGADGLKKATEFAVLNANYIREKLKNVYELPYNSKTLHEVVFSENSFKKFGVKTVDLAKRILDYGFHPPTVYFPLIVHGALMIEPTETESKTTLDDFIKVMKKIHKEAEETPELLKEAPHNTPVKRLNEVLAAKKPKLIYKTGE
jgi:glycine dehydrogenase subunit 2